MPTSSSSSALQYTGLIISTDSAWNSHLIACCVFCRVSKKPCCQGSNQQVKYDNVKTEEQIYKEGDAAYLSPKYSGKNQCPLPRKTKNDYFHIWEHPLPDPGSSSVEQHGPQQLKVKLPPKETRNNNSTDTGSVAGYHVSMTSKSSDADSKYFILDRDINFDKEEPYP